MKTTQDGTMQSSTLLQEYQKNVSMIKNTADLLPVAKPQGIVLENMYCTHLKAKPTKEKYDIKNL